MYIHWLEKKAHVENKQSELFLKSYHILAAQNGFIYVYIIIKCTQSRYM